MIRLRSYLFDRWHDGDGPTRSLVNPSTEEAVAETSTSGIDFAGALAHARDVGGPALRAMSFVERAGLLKAMSRKLYEHREELLKLSTLNNGATRGDGKFDVDGATGTLAAYARLGKDMGDTGFLLDGESEKLSSGARYVGQHVHLPRPGVAVHVNAFNFPAWGTFEKVAVSILAGMPVISKPATATALVAWRCVDILVEAGIVPPGTLGLIPGPAGDLLDHLGPQDCLAFTGSADTAGILRGGPGVLHRSARINVEADSLNATVMGPDVDVESDLWHRFVRNIVTDMTQKTGQKCTAIRRILVPEDKCKDLCAAVADELSRVTVGNPSDSNVRMGPVATSAQLRDGREGIAWLAEQTHLVCGGTDPIQGVSAPEGKGYFIAPTLLCTADARAADRVHTREVFGPVATAISYDGSAAEAAAIVALGQGSLVSSVFSDDRTWMSEFLMDAAPWNGRVLAVNTKVVDQTLPPGMVLPNQLHGGPGRAGGGEELGGLRGLPFYMNRVAIQGDLGMLRKIFGTA